MVFKHVRSWIKTKRPSRNDVAPPEGAVIPPQGGLDPQNGAVPAHKGQIGLLPLNPIGINTNAVPSADRYSLDIVAIHGITGDAFGTWTHENGTNWLRDYLPKEFPGARIFTYGYPAEVLCSRSDGNIDSFARALLNDLRIVRRELKVDMPLEYD
jgi:hypothetical protein